MKARIDNWKTIVKPQYLLNMFSQYGDLRPLKAEICSRDWGTPANFNRFRVLAALLHGTLVVGVSQTLRPWTDCATYIRSMLTALLHGTGTVGVIQTLRHGTRNGVTELSQRAPPIFGRAVITLGIGPHSSYSCSDMAISVHLCKQFSGLFSWRCS